MKTKLLTGIMTIGAIAATAYAFNPEIKEALSNNDYNSWVDAIDDSPRGEEMLSIVDESNFSQLVEAHNLRQSGDLAGAKEIMESLGLEEFFGKGPGHNGFKGNPEKMQAVKDALDAGDYQAWIDAMGTGKRAQEMLSIINESNFNQLVEAHNLIAQGHAIMQELGLPEMGGFGPEKFDKNTENME